MSIFDDRERAEEKRFAMDAATTFKIMARRNKLFGLWAAQKLNLAGAEAEAYARAVIASDLEEPGEEDVFRKVRADLDVGGVDCKDQYLREKMAEFLAIAQEQIRQETD